MPQPLPTARFQGYSIPKKMFLKLNAAIPNAINTLKLTFFNAVEITFEYFKTT